MGQVDIFCRIIWSITLIKLTPVAEPLDFNGKVRVPGTAFLIRTPNPNHQQWRRNDYWRLALGDLFGAYNGICAYCSSWTFRTDRTTRPQDGTVDHFVPKSVVPVQAYEWVNFRLCRRRLNERKGNNRDVLDPFTIAPGWFGLDFRTFRLIPNQVLSSMDSAYVVATIDRLQLNDDNDYVNERIGAIREYCLGRATISQLDKWYPFLAAEMRVQGFDTNYFPKLRAFFAQNTRI